MESNARQHHLFFSFFFFFEELSAMLVGQVSTNCQVSREPHTGWQSKQGTHSQRKHQAGKKNHGKQRKPQA